MIAGWKKKSISPSPQASDPIGIFDSGVGGLSILRELRRLMPQERFVFLADQAHVPYGEKSADELIVLTSRITRFLLRKHCKLIVVACNTATCYAIGSLRTRFAIPFVGVVPAIKPACLKSRTGVVGVISTPATARSRALRDLIRRFAEGTTVIRVGCPGLEELIEGGGLAGPAVDRILQTRLMPLRAAGADFIVLGCTHYPFLRGRIARIANARTLDSGHAVAQRTQHLLRTAGVMRIGSGSVSYYTTGDSRAFTRVASKLLRHRIRAKKARV